MTSKAELEPITELNWPTRPHAKTAVEALPEDSTKDEAEAPPFAVVAQHTMPRPARGRMADFRVNRWRLWVVSGASCKRGGGLHLGCVDEHERYREEEGEEKSDHGLRRNVLVLWAQSIEIPTSDGLLSYCRYSIWDLPPSREDAS